jgi:glutathione S-transferase
VLTAGVPGPWGEAAKGIFHVKHLGFVAVRQVAAGPNTALREWTCQTSAPVAVWNDERPRTTWVDQLFLAERLASEPALVPAEAADRALMFGLAHEICGEHGLGWSRRLMMLDRTFHEPNPPEAQKRAARAIAAKYGYTEASAAAAPGRVAQVLELLAVQLAEQQRRGREFLVGERLTALDIYWATFAAMVAPLPAALCPMPERLRAVYTLDPPPDAALLAHRDRIYRDILPTPLDF